MVVGVRIASVSRVRNFSARIVARSFHNACRAACDAPRGAASLPPSLPSLPLCAQPGRGGKGRRRAQPCERTRRRKGRKKRRRKKRGIRVFRYDRNLNGGIAVIRINRTNENTGTRIGGQGFDSSTFLRFSTRSLPPCSLFHRSKGSFIGLTSPFRLVESLIAQAK